MDRKKYIVEASDDVKKVIALGVTHGGAIWTDTTDIENLEELNSDYINEHFSDLQDDAYNKGYAQCQDDYSDALKHAKDTAYKKGLHDGESKCRYCNEYQRGLDDAWEAARKIVCDEELDWNTLLHIFNRSNFEGIFGDFSPSEAIAKLKAYEEKQKADDEIKVGDEVEISQSDANGIWVVIKVEKHDGYEAYCAINKDGDIYFEEEQDRVTKTGRHFDIESILEDMRE